MSFSGETRTKIEQLETSLGSEVGVSEWLVVTQQMIDQFADLTGDHSWIHVDPDRARATPFGGTIAHGFFTLALASYFLPQVLELEAGALNYGLNRVRFPAPLRVGAAVRMRATLEGVEAGAEAATVSLGLVFEAKQSEKPVCVAEWIIREDLAEPR